MAKHAKPKPPPFELISAEAQEYAARLGVVIEPTISERVFAAAVEHCRKKKRPFRPTDGVDSTGLTRGQVANALGNLRNMGRVVLLGKGQGYIPKVDE